MKAYLRGSALLVGLVLLLGLPFGVFGQTQSNLETKAFKQYCLTYQDDQVKQQELCTEYWATPEYAVEFVKYYGVTIDVADSCAKRDPEDNGQAARCGEYWSNWSVLDETPVTTDGYDSGVEQIENFSSNFTVNTDGSLTVKETITYNFGSQEKHGIYRDIPIVYKTKMGGTARLDLTQISVVDEKGAAYTYTTFKNGNDRRIKVGDANILIKGIHTYIVSYVVPHAVGFYDSFDEIYWNVTGTGWPVAIKNAEASVTIPYSVTTDEEFNSTVKMACYKGEYGSEQKCDSFTNSHTAGAPITVTFKQQNLNASEGLTVAVGFPKGFVTAPTTQEKINSFLSDFLSSGWLFLIMPIVMFVYGYRRWSKAGRNPKTSGIIIPQYEAPDNLSPLQVAFIFKGMSTKKIVSEVVYLATQGFLKINKIKSEIFFIKNDFELVKVKEVYTTLQPFQALLMTSLFKNEKNSIKLSSMRYSFYSKAAKVATAVQQDLIDKGYFPPAAKSNIEGLYGEKRIPNIVFMSVFGILFGSVFGSVVAMALFGDHVVVPFIVSWVIALVCTSFFSIIMPTITEKGALTKEKIAGFKLYLSLAEKDRIAFHDAPAKNPEVFQKFLPYAIALGVEKEWAKVFEGMDMQSPEWYSDSTMSHFNSSAFASGIAAFSKSGSSTMSSIPGSRGGSGGSSGGGSSGGGGGGGGGGSW